MEAIYNKQANFDYEIIEKYDAGLVLSGQEAKSIKNGQINFKGSFITIRHIPLPELFLTNAHISPYKFAGNLVDYNPTRPRKLLVTKHELKTLLGKLEQKGLTLVPIKVYTKHNLIKLEFGLGKGKKKFEKKEALKNKAIDKDIKRTLKFQI